MAQGLDEVAALPDPIGTELARWTRPNGLDIARVRVPLGVIGIIYESRPNVTADAGGLCLRAGNAAILRGGSESFHSSRAIAAALRDGIAAAGLPEEAVQLVPTVDRAAVGMMLAMTEFIDLIVPRGGKSLIERVQRESRMPVIAHLEGNCHVYVHRAADLAMAREDRAQRQDAAHRRVRRGGDLAGRSRDRRRWPCRRFSPRCIGRVAKFAATRPCARSMRRPAPRPRRIGSPNISTPSSPYASSTDLDAAISPYRPLRFAPYRRHRHRGRRGRAAIPR